MIPPAITTPAAILSFFIIFLLKNFALSGDVPVGGFLLKDPALSGDVSVGGEGKGGDPSDGKWCQPLRH